MKKIRIELGWKKYIINENIYHIILLHFYGHAKTVLNILTGRWVDPNGKLFQKLIREGYRYANRLSDYLEDISIGIIYVGEFELDPLADFYYPALIPPLSVLAIRADIRENFIISVESAVVGGMSLFTLEKINNLRFKT